MNALKQGDMRNFAYHFFCLGGEEWSEDIHLESYRSFLTVNRSFPGGYQSIAVSYRSFPDSYRSFPKSYRHFGTFGSP